MFHLPVTLRTIKRNQFHLPLRKFCQNCSVLYSKQDATPNNPFPDKHNLSVEQGWYDWWKESGYFKPKAINRKAMPGEQIKFSMVLPPPNVTGVLHLGHALTASVQDALVRYHRMKGCETVWVPGSDHAGIATQIVVEKQLNAKQGITKQDLGREKFIEKVQEWKKEKGDTILKQLEEMGASLDWSRTQFTLSPEYTQSVNKAFIQLFNKGIIYRKESLINWCSVLQSTISDIEVNHVSVEGRTNFQIPGFQGEVEFGVMTDIAYKVTNSCDEIVVSTTRPETMLGDTAIAVNPNDSRYAHLVGQTVWHPFREEEIPIIADSYVDPEFGTGAVKITPAHDPNDFEIGVGHGLPMLKVFNEDGTVNENGGEFRDEHRFAVRSSICDKLERLGLYRGSKDHAMSIPVCGRTGDVVEPMIKDQWFIDTSKIGELASKAVKENDLRLDPPSFEAVWENFLGKDKNIDWCISRQLWWGHRVPAWWIYRNDDSSNGVWIAAETKEEALKQGSEKLGTAPDNLEGHQDPDVLDTWFSSGLYPFAAFGWPNENPDLEKFFPLDLMETGNDILFFWVARMVMLSIALQGKLPFSDVMLHGIICDSQGRKMSKSLGNVIDPMHMIHGASLEQLNKELDASSSNGYLSAEEVELSKSELSKTFPDGIPASGADALRWALLSYDVKSQQMNLDPELVPRAKIWCNKIWQVSRLLVQAHQRAKEAEKDLGTLPKDFRPSLMDMWILNQLANTVSRVNDEFEEKNFDEILKEIRGFLYGNVCDVYVEYIKRDLQDPDSPRFHASLMFFHTCIMTSLKMLHPIMPFITEELYHRIPTMPKETRQESIMVDSYPQPTQWSGFVNPTLGALMERVLLIVSGIRSTKANYSLVKGSLPDVIIHSDNQTEMAHLQQFSEVICRLSNSGELNFTVEKPDLASLPLGCAVNSAEGLTVGVFLGDHMDIEKEIKKVEEKKAKIHRDIKKLDKANKGKFQYREKPEVTEEKRKKFNEELQSLDRQLTLLKNMNK